MPKHLQMHAEFLITNLYQYHFVGILEKVLTWPLFSCTSLIISFVLCCEKYRPFFSTHVLKDSSKIQFLWRRLPTRPPLGMLFLPSSVCLWPPFGPFLMIVASYCICPSSTALAQLTFWTGKFFVVGTCLVYCRVFRSIPSLNQLDACISQHHPSCDSFKGL